LLTNRLTLAVAVLYVAVSVGVKVVLKVFVPADRIVPASGLYTKLPGTLVVAFNCVPLNAVPYGMLAGLDHVIDEVM
jgi:hypothetical protein